MPAMRTSIYISRFLILLPCVIFPLYHFIRASALLPDIAVALSSLSESTEAIHIELSSLIATRRAPFSKEHSAASVEPAKVVQGAKRVKKDSFPSLPEGLAHSINSFEQYPLLAEQVLKRKYARYSKQPPSKKAISDKLGYNMHFERARDGIEVNAQLLTNIAQIARSTYHIGSWDLEDGEDADFGLVDLALGHLLRDWSTQGARERQAVFPPILGALEEHFGKLGNGLKVLVPGSGMGRLASDIADQGWFKITLPC